MSRYMYLFRGGDARTHQLNDQENASHMKEWELWMNMLSEKGALIEGMPLSREGRCVSNEGSQVSKDLHAEGGTSVGGFMIVNADNFNQAVELSRGCPIFHKDGEVEIREIKPM